MLEQIMTIGFVTAFLTASVRMAVPLIYAGLGETISEKAGILNIGMEGVMLGGAFFSFAGTLYSGSLAVGLLCGMAGGAMVSAIHGLLSIRLAQDQSVSGIAINIFMAGVTSFLYKLMSSGQSYQQIEPFAKLKMPFLGDIPLIGNALFNQDILTYGVYVLVILVALFYSRTSKGMAFAAIGENPRAAAAAGRWASGRYMVKFTPAGSYCFSACWVPSTMARPQLATGARRFTPPSPTGTSNRFKFR